MNHIIKAVSALLILALFSIGAHAQNKVVVIPLDSSTPKTKFISLNVYADPGLNWDTRYTGGDDAGVGNHNLDVDFNFTIPPDYTNGTSMTIRVLAYARNGTGNNLCNANLSYNWRFVMRASVGIIPAAKSPVGITHVMTQDHVAEEFLFSIGGSGLLQTGDSVSFGLWANTQAPSCDLIISGVSVQYQ